MKSVLSLIAVFGFALSMSAADVQLIVESVDNGGLVPGNTYRVYAVLPSTEHTLHAVFADTNDQLAIETTGEFYQNPLGHSTTMNINPNVITAEPKLAFDSWVTIGAENNMNNNLWDIGIEFDSFDDGGQLSVEDGAWFLIPTDVRCLPDANGKILLAQLTTTGTATGTLNFQGWDGEGEVWQARGLTFSTDNAEVFGCTDMDANNYNIAATYNDGSCQYDNTAPSVGVTGNGISSIKDEGVMVFPNPVIEGQFNLQFAQVLDLREDNLIIEIFDQAGKRVMAQEITNEAVVGGNRVVISHSLAAGQYTVNVSAGDFSDVKQVIVGR
jgi:hypothetical protein